VHDHRCLYRRINNPSAFHRELHKYLLEMPLSPTSISTDIIRRHFIESCTGNATLTDDSTDGSSPSTFHRELWKYHNHRRLYRWIQSVGICRQFTITNKITDKRFEFQRAGINASLSLCTCR
jgi:hypothetical protein